MIKQLILHTKSELQVELTLISESPFLQEPAKINRKGNITVRQFSHNDGP